MKRSQIDRAIERALALFERQGLHLPRWARWSPADWEGARFALAEFAAAGLGWDVTDFGFGRFEEVGLVLFTLRNGRPDTARAYCEKLMLVEPGQVTPWHFHRRKSEDIINRGGGVLQVRVAGANALGDDFAAEPVTVAVDGFLHTIAAGDAVALAPGESISLPPRLYHEFSALAGAAPVLCGEVSSVNDDAADNRFLHAPARFPDIEEDAPRRHLLCTEYLQ